MVRQFTTQDTLLQLWVLTTDNTVVEEIERYREVAHHTQWAPHFKSKQRTIEFWGTRYLLKQMVAGNAAICYDEHGKPYLNDGSYHISISHTKGYIGIALHPTKAVGVDIELLGNKIGRVADRFLSTAELSSARNTTSLHLYWSAKEAVYKLIGADCVDFRNDILLGPVVANRRNDSLAAAVIRQNRQVTVHYWIEDRFVLTVTADS